MSADDAMRNARTKRRLSKEQTRAAMLEAGMAMLVDQGLAPSVDHVSIEATFRAAGVARSSAYNAWTSHHGALTPQAAFHRDLLHHAVVTGPTAKNMETLFAEAAAIIERADQLSADELRRQLIRVAGEAHYHQCTVDRNLAVGIALSATAHTTQPGGERGDLATEVLQWWKHAEEEWRNRLIDDVFKPLIRFLALEPNPTLDGPHFWEQFVTALNAYGAGILPRIQTADPAVMTISRPGPHGEMQDWSLFSVGLEALIEHFFKPRNANQAH